jgi:molybdenum cofactor cytidylyltransferase
VILDVLKAASQGQGSIVVPVFAGTRGHPTWIAWRHRAGITALAPGLGLNTYLRQHAHETLEVPVTARGVVEDLDTPEDYRRMLGQNDK